MQTKVSISNQILPDSAYQPALYFAHCGANLLSYQWHFFKERGDFLETRPHATSIAYYRIGACRPGSCFNTDAMEDVWRVWLKIKTAHLCCLYFICKLRAFSVCVFTQGAGENVWKSFVNHWIFAGFSQAEICAGIIITVTQNQSLFCYWGRCALAA